eukprot:107684_1
MMLQLKRYLLLAVLLSGSLRFGCSALTPREVFTERLNNGVKATTSYGNVAILGCEIQEENVYKWNTISQIWQPPDAYEMDVYWPVSSEVASQFTCSRDPPAFVEEKVTGRVMPFASLEITSVGHRAFTMICTEFGEVKEVSSFEKCSERWITEDQDGKPCFRIASCHENVTRKLGPVCSRWYEAPIKFSNGNSRSDSYSGSSESYSSDSDANAEFKMDAKLFDRMYSKLKELDAIQNAKTNVGDVDEIAKSSNLASLTEEAINTNTLPGTADTNTNFVNSNTNSDMSSTNAVLSNANGFKIYENLSDMNTNRFSTTTIPTNVCSNLHSMNKVSENPRDESESESTYFIHFNTFSPNTNTNSGSINGNSVDPSTASSPDYTNSYQGGLSTKLAEINAYFDNLRANDANIDEHSVSQSKTPATKFENVSNVYQSPTEADTNDKIELQADTKLAATPTIGLIKRLTQQPNLNVSYLVALFVVSFIVLCVVAARSKLCVYGK